jgi:hypothetical protein
MNYYIISSLIILLLIVYAYFATVNFNECNTKRGILVVSLFSYKCVEELKNGK